MSEAMDAIVALRRENDLLRARLADLEVASTDTSLIPAVVAFGLTPTEARLFNLLVRRVLLSRAAAFAALYGDRRDPPDEKVLAVFVCKMRTKLARRGIAIDTVSVGWRLSPEARGLARALLDEAAAA